MNLKHCQTCGRELTPGQIAKRLHTCSRKCRGNCADLNKDAMREPYTEAEAIACEAQVAAGKRHIRMELDAVIFQRTPLDDSPEAERRLREAVVGEVEEFAEV